MKQLIRIVILLVVFVSCKFSKEEDINNLVKLDSLISNQEKELPNVIEECKAKVLWNSNYIHKKAPIAFVYLHGFGASHREGSPIVEKLSSDFKANVYLARLSGHGLKDASGYEKLTPEKYIASAKRALKIGKQIGEKVILISTSTGGTLSLKLASEDNDISALVLYSPFVDVIDKKSFLVLKSEGKEFMIAKNGGEVFEEKRPKEQLPYWSTKYHINGYVALLQMLQNTMTLETFNKVTCPVFLAYYYKDQEHQDKVVSVEAMLSMFDKLGTNVQDKQKMAFPNAGNHVIGCDLRSNDWQGVYQETNKFIINKVIK